MTLPTIITVVGVIGDSSGPQAGRIVWHKNVPSLPAASDDLSYQIPEEIVSVVVADGVLNQPIYSTDDPAASPTGWHWTVTTHFPHWKQTFSVVIPYNSPGGVVNFNRLAPVPPDGDGQLYALANHTHSGGGGGGAVDSVFGRTGNVVAQAGDYSKSLVGLGNVDNTADASKAFSASQITSGSFAIARIPVGTTSVTVAAGDRPAAVVTAHEAAGDPHAQYLTAAEGNAAYDVLGAATAALASATAADSAHVAASDPHTGYLRESVLTAKGSLYIATGSATVVELPVGTDGQVLTADSAQTPGAKWATPSGGGGSAITVVRRKVTTGDIIPQNNSGSWAALTGGPSISIAAAAGDYVEFQVVDGMYDPQGSFMDLAVQAGGVLVRYMGSDTSSPLIEGAPAFYGLPGTFRGYGPTFEFVVVSGDIDTGAVKVVFAVNSNGTGKLYASTNYPLKWRAVNYGAVSVS